MRHTRTLLLLCCLLLSFIVLKAQQPQTSKLKVAVFAPVYLDSVFTGDTFRPANSNSLPRYMLPGLDFYNGVMLAIDSLNTERAPVQVLFYDTKSTGMPLDKMLESPELSGTSLIIASFNTRHEVKPVADYALKNNIPLLSSTYPNDGGVEGNPFFVLLNPTLRTHCEGLYKYLQRIYPTTSMVMFRKKGAAEDMIQSIFGEMARNTQGVPLKIKTVELPDSFTTAQVTGYLDSNRQNIVICGSLNEAFGLSLTRSLNEAKNSYRSIAAGMPTWDALKDIDKGIEIIYSTPYNYQRADKEGLSFTAKYRAKYAGRPSDMAFKGFESMYHFTKLLVKHQSALINNLSDNSFKLFNEFNVQPVRISAANPMPLYLENKKLYFVRKIDGQIRSVSP